MTNLDPAAFEKERLVPEGVELRPRGSGGLELHVRSGKRSWWMRLLGIRHWAVAELDAMDVIWLHQAIVKYTHGSVAGGRGPNVPMALMEMTAARGVLAGPGASRAEAVRHINNAVVWLTEGASA